jgi:hypothetical protein
MKILKFGENSDILSLGPHWGNYQDFFYFLARKFKKEKTENKIFLADRASQEKTNQWKEKY